MFQMHFQGAVSGEEIVNDKLLKILKVRKQIINILKVYDLIFRLGFLAYQPYWLFNAKAILLEEQ